MIQSLLTFFVLMSLAGQSFHTARTSTVSFASSATPTTIVSSETPASSEISATTATPVNSIEEPTTNEPASPVLTRISAVERSDGKGFVIRFHTTEKIDSVSVYQPSAELLQIVLYQASLPIATQMPDQPTELPKENDIFGSFELFDIPNGLAVDIHIKPGHTFNYDTYPDQNLRDQLLTLTYASEDELTGLIDGLIPIDWSLYAFPNQPTPISETSLSTGPNADSQENTITNMSDLREELSRYTGAELDVVVIDPGHGGKDPGTLGINNLKEKDIVLEVARKVGEYLNEYIPELNVVYTRTDDRFLGLAERGRLANEMGGDLFISIHANSFAHANRARQQRPNGAEIFFLGVARSQAAVEVMKRENSVLRFEEDTRELTEQDLLIYELTNAGNMQISEQLAEKMERQFRERAQRSSRGVKQAGFQVLYEASMPAVLIELGFLSNPAEARYLSTEYGQSIMASAIFRAIRDFKQRVDLANEHLIAE